MKRGRLLMVTWLDSVGLGRGGWQLSEEVAELEPANIETVGWVLSESSTHITLAATWDNNDPPHVEGHMCIPKAAIVKRRRLK